MDEQEATAARLVAAVRDRAPIPPLTDANPDMTVLDAYRIQQLVVRDRLPTEGPVVGYKVGLTSKPMQELLGIDTPDYGPILAAMYRSGDTTLDLDELIHPRVEAEIAFQLGSALRGPGVDADDVLAATTGVMAAIEVIDSRIVDWRIRLADTIADNASSALVVLGDFVPLAELDLAAVEATLEVARPGGESDSVTGAGDAVLGHPARAVAWCAAALHEVAGETIAAGEIVLPGAMARALPLAPGDVVRASFAGLGLVEATVA